MLWEVLWECLEARKTNDMSLLERVNYRSDVIMWTWRDLIEEAELRGEGVERTTEELMVDKKKGAIDQSAHQNYARIGGTGGAAAGGTQYRVKLRRSTKHRKMFPGFYRGELLAPSAESISRHNKLIRKLLGEELSKSVMQTRQHDGVEIRKTLFSESDSDSESDRHNSSSSSSSSSSEDDGEGSGESGGSGGGRGRRKKKTKVRRRESTLRAKSGKKKSNNQRSHANSYDGENTSDEDSDGGAGSEDTEKSTFGTPRNARGSVTKGRRRRSVVVRNLAGFGKALIGM